MIMTKVAYVTKKLLQQNFQRSSKSYKSQTKRTRKEKHFHSPLTYSVLENGQKIESVAV